MFHTAQTLPASSTKIPISAHCHVVQLMKAEYEHQKRLLHRPRSTRQTERKSFENIGAESGNEREHEIRSRRHGTTFPERGHWRRSRAPNDRNPAAHHRNTHFRWRGRIVLASWVNVNATSLRARSAPASGKFSAAPTPWASAASACGRKWASWALTRKTRLTKRTTAPAPNLLQIR
jgi:hypothetical protein